MTGDQCRQARKLLGWTQRDLARKISAWQGTISSFERSGKMHRSMYEDRDRLSELRGVLEAAGVEFADENGGAGVRLRKVEP